MTPVVLDDSHVDEAAAVLVPAFEHERSSVYVMPDARRRADLGLPIAAALIRYALRYGQVTALTAPLRVVALWLAPGHTTATDEALGEVGMWGVLEAMERGEQDRLAHLWSDLAEVHARLMPEPHWYLQYIGVEPASQGQGLGSALMAPMLAQISAHQWPCYLETFEARTVPLYERHGFRVAYEGMLTQTELQVWAMRRD